MLTRLALGLFLSSLIGYAGYRREALSPSGMFGALIVGTAVFGFGGLAWGVLLVMFFVSSSALSRFRAAQKEALAEKFSKGSRRDLGQVLANGGLGALLALGYALSPSPWLWAAFVGAMAEVNADTWATELGVLNRTRPRLITTGRAVEVGDSGAVSPTGTAAAVAGAAAIAFLAAAFSGGAPAAMAMAAAGVIGGVAGALFDSLLGATIQQIFYCDHCGKETERAVHLCGNVTRRLRGWRWLDNEGVNFLSSVVGAAIAAGVGSMLS